MQIIRQFCPFGKALALEQSVDATSRKGETPRRSSSSRGSYAQCAIKHAMHNRAREKLSADHDHSFTQRK